MMSDVSPSSECLLVGILLAVAPWKENPVCPTASKALRNLFLRMLAGQLLIFIHPLPTEAVGFAQGSAEGSVWTLQEEGAQQESLAQQGAP